MRIFFAGAELLPHKVFSHKDIQHGAFIDQLYTHESLRKKKSKAREIFQKTIKRRKKYGKNAEQSEP